MNRKRILTAISLLAVVTMMLTIVGTTISWLVFPQWEGIPNGKWILLANVCLGILGFINLFTNTLKNFKDLAPEKQDRQVYRCCPPDEYRKRLGEPKGWSIAWVDRGATSAAMLKALPSGRLLISGRMKAGKTREAIELIQQLIESEAVPAQRVFEPTNGFNLVDQQALARAMEEIADPRQALVWFVDDLPRFCRGEVQLERMAEWLDKLDKLVDLYVLATARSDDIDQNPKLKDWLKEQHFTTIELADLHQEHALALVDRAAPVYHLLLDEAARQAFAAGIDGRPEHLRLALSKLQSGDKSPLRVERETAERVMRESLLELWREQHARIEEQNPAAGYRSANPASPKTRRPPRAQVWV